MGIEARGKEGLRGVLHYDELAEDDGTIHDTKEKSSKLGSYNLPNPNISQSQNSEEDDDIYHTGEKVNTIPNPMALTSLPPKYNFHSTLACCIPIPTAFNAAPIQIRCFLPIMSIRYPAIMTPTASPPVVAPFQALCQIAGTR